MDASREAEPTGSAQDQGPGADLDRICADLHVDRATATEFAVNYLTLLSSRLQRIDQELDLLVTTGRSTAGRDGATQLNVDPALVALLSLDASSVMLGAVEVSLAVQRLRRDVQSGRLNALDQPRQDLWDAVARLRPRLLALVATD